MKPYERAFNVVIFFNQKQLFLLTNDREMWNSYYHHFILCGSAPTSNSYFTGIFLSQLNLY